MENHGKTLEKWEKHMNNVGKSIERWENHSKIIGKILGKPKEHDGLYSFIMPMVIYFYSGSLTQIQVVPHSFFVCKK